jgi:hypothetical protein
VAAFPAPGREVDAERGMAPGDRQFLTGAQRGERVLKQQVTALVEAKVVKAGNRWH